MIQQTDFRRPTTNGATSTNQTGGCRESWGKWVGRRHYSLEIVQHPIRARMCGFGDKDRRPLAPAAVAKLVVRRDDDTIVDVDEIDYTFFLATVDLWSEDGKQEMNLVLHPTSSDRSVPFQAKGRKRLNSGKAKPSDNGTPGPASSLHPTTQTDAPESATSSNNSSSSNNYNPPYSIQPPHQTSLEPMNYTGAQQPSAEWDYGSHQPGDGRADSQSTLPSIQSFNRVNGTWHEDSTSRNQSETPAFRAWPPDSTYDNVETENRQSESTNQPLQQQQSQPDHRNGSNQWQEVPLVSNSEGFSGQGKHSSSTSQHSREQSTSPMINTMTQMDTSMYASASYVQNQQYYPASNHQQPEAFQSGSSIPLPRHTYTRTLVGPLCANASKLSDEHRKPGIFFLFQDLSIRTEGAFCLRIRLMNVGAPPAPEPGAVKVHSDVSPVLAQAFTEPFTVYSAKRFPGVPDTTALSIAFGNQGQKLPLRNRHGTSKSRKRARSASDGGSEDDSD
ncbi:hypothetical protein BDM02DRAFT_3111084 [Thelephora ganbajun]|uniref:Uncharacterized protein n=1 Tax=Thelephora ganbajun TaxID=370292 RepID=A0ACB6ZNS7_THEGA|nr:hypothetical protein BDM02DRAFT_3111084 [Thelephora ganbajun]